MDRTSIDYILNEVVEERIFQNKKWNRTFFDWPSTEDRKNTVLNEEVGEISRAILNNDKKNLREELIQVAATSIAWIESLDKK